MVDTLKTTLIARAKHAGAYEAKVADPRVGFEHGIPGRRPLDLWDRCRSVIVCAVPNPAWANNTYVGTIRSEQDSVPLGQMPGFVFSPRYALRRLNNYLRLYVLHEVQNALRSDGYEAKTDERTQEKLSAYEAGIGVYGRSGVIVHPVLGVRMSLVTVLTDAALEPDTRLADFDPCNGCYACVKACPAGAFDLQKAYPQSFQREKCTSKRADLESEQLYCHHCWSVCPACKLPKDELCQSVQATSYTDRKRRQPAELS